MIVSFDLLTFQQTRSTKSETYQESLCNYNIISSETFKGKEKWCNRDVLLPVVIRCPRHKDGILQSTKEKITAIGVEQYVCVGLQKTHAILKGAI